MIGIEACGASHHWARILRSFGHEVKLIAPQLVKPYVKRGKNDTADAEALCEAMIYVLLFALFLILPWTAETAMTALVVYAIGIGVIAIVVLFRLASARHLGGLVIAGRLAGPTEIFQLDDPAMFMTEALFGVFLASRRELPGVLRGLLLAFAAASLQLCVVGQSRGWLFTLPAVLVLFIIIVPDRLRVILAAILPALAALLPVHTLLHVFEGTTGESLRAASRNVGSTSLLLCAGVFVIWTLFAWAEDLRKVPRISRGVTRGIGVVVSVAGDRARRRRRARHDPW